MFLFCEDSFAEDNDSWLDNMQVGVSQSINSSANWFDDFFEQEAGTEQANASAKVRLGIVPIEEDWMRFDSKVRLRAKLPNLKDRWDIIISDYDDNQEQNAADESINDASGANDDEQLNLAIRFIHSTKDNQYISSRVGFARGTDIYFKTRYRRKFDLTTWLNMEVEPALYYYLDHGFGAKFEMDFKFAQTESGLFKQVNRWETIQDDAHPSWRHSLLYYYQLSERAALINGVFATGRLIDDQYLYDNRGLFMRYRCQAVRKWIYFEVEPFVHFPNYRAHERTFGMALRVEINFGDY